MVERIGMDEKKKRREEKSGIWRQRIRIFWRLNGPIWSDCNDYFDRFENSKKNPLGSKKRLKSSEKLTCLFTNCFTSSCFGITEKVFHLLSLSLISDDFSRFALLAFHKKYYSMDDLTVSHHGSDTIWIREMKDHCVGYGVNKMIHNNKIKVVSAKKWTLDAIKNKLTQCFIVSTHLFKSHIFMFQYSSCFFYFFSLLFHSTSSTLTHFSIYIQILPFISIIFYFFVHILTRSTVPCVFIIIHSFVEIFVVVNNHCERKQVFVVVHIHCVCWSRREEEKKILNVAFELWKMCKCNRWPSRRAIYFMVDFYLHSHFIYMATKWMGILRILVFNIWRSVSQASSDTISRELNECLTIKYTHEYGKRKRYHIH